MEVATPQRPHPDYAPCMDRDREQLERQLKEAERELDAARKPSEIRPAAQKRRLAMQALQWLDEQERKAKPKR
jgi:hypothetical protein